MKFKYILLLIVLLSCMGCAYASGNISDEIVVSNVDEEIVCDNESVLKVPDMEYTYLDTGSVNISSSSDDEVVSASVEGHSEANVTFINKTIFVNGLDAGEYSLSVLSKLSGSPVYSKIIVNKYLVDLKPKVTALYYQDNGLIDGYVEVYGENCSFSSFAAEIENEPISNIIVNGSFIYFKNLKTYHNYNLIVNLTENNYRGSARVGLSISPGRTNMTIPDIVFDWGSSGSADVITNASGVLLNDTTFNEFVNIDGKSISVAGLAVGEYDISFVTSDMNYDTVYGTVHVIVNPVESYLYPIDEFEYDWSFGSVSVDYDYAINVSANVVGHEEAFINISDKMISISNLDVGDYILNVSTIPDNNHTSVYQCVAFKINKIDCSIVLNVDNVKYNQKAVVRIFVPDSASGVVNVVFNNRIYLINLTNNEKSVELPLLPVGDYSLFAFYEGDINYNPVNLDLQYFNVSYYTACDLKNKIDNAGNVLTIDEDYIFKSDDEPVNINASIKINFKHHIIDGNGTTGIFNISANNVELSNLVLTNSNGFVINSNGNNTILNNILLNHTSTIGIDADDVNLKNITVFNSLDNVISIKGNGAILEDINIENCKNNPINISGNNSFLKNILFKCVFNDGIIINGDYSVLDNVSIVDSFGNGINVNGCDSKIFNVNLNSNDGIAICVNGSRCNITHICVIQNNGTALIVNGSRCNITHICVRQNNGTALIVNGNNSVIDNAIFSNNSVDESFVVLVNSDNTSILNSIFENNTCMDNIGVKKDLNLVVDLFTQNHGGLSREITRIIDVDVVVDKFDAKILLNVSVDEGIVFCVVDNKTYSSSVSNGSAILELNDLAVGEYNVCVVYNGSENYSKAFAGVNFTIVKQFIGLSASSHVYVVNYNRIFSVVLSSKLSGMSIFFTLNGKNYVQTTNKDGVAVFNLDKVIVSQNILVSFNGDDKYLSSSVNVKITINKEKTSLKVKSKKSFKKNALKKITVTLKNSKNKILKNKWVYLKISAMKVKKVKTNSRGVVIFKLKGKFKVGGYKYSVIYKGDKYFNKSIKKGSFKIK